MIVHAVLKILCCRMFRKKIALANWSHHMSLSASLCKNGNLVAQVHVQNSVDIWKIWGSVFLLKYLYIPEWGSWLELLFGETAASALSTRSLYCQGTMGSLVSQGWLFLSSRERWAFTSLFIDRQLGLKNVLKLWNRFRFFSM